MTELINVNVTQIAPLQELFQFKKALDETIKRWLVKDLDYGIIPGAKKPCLLKPGAEKLCFSVGYKIDYEIVDSTIDHSLFLTYEKKEYGHLKTGETLGLYRYVVKCLLRDRGGNHVGSALGICSSLESKYCDRPRNLENTIIKMAEKRALVAVTINALALSGTFTQDLEDVAPEVVTETSRQKTLHHKPVAPDQAASKPKSFDKNNKVHQDVFIALMNKHNVTDVEKWDDIANRLHGRPSSELEACIKEILGAEVGGIG